MPKTALNSESRLALLFRRTSMAIESGRYDSAARIAESAWRFAPLNPTALLLHCRLLLKVGAAREAVDLLRDRDDPRSLTVLGEAACAARLFDIAHQACQSLLRGFAVDAVEGMASATEPLCQAVPQRFPGWVGVSSKLRLVGAAPAGSTLTVELSARELGRIEIAGKRGSLGAFSIAMPLDRPGVVRMRAGRVELLGSGLHWPPDFRANGWVVWEDGILLGEASLDWAPQSALQIQICNRDRTYALTVNPVERGDTGWNFSEPFPKLSSIGADVVEVAVVLPGGGSAPLVGSPLTLGVVTQTPVGAMHVGRSVRRRHSTVSPRVNVVVPVYGGFEETRACLRSVLATTNAQTATVTVVDDASPDAALREWLDGLAHTGRITLLRNSHNLGFPGAANRGLRRHPERDVVLLNSDAEVFEGWLDRLRAVAYSDTDVGTVTPFGDAASITTYSDRNKRSYSALEAAAVDRIARTVNGERSIEIPVGVGFCLYIRRSCLDETGELDEVAFSRGYGEENDFCLRARHLGWRHLAAAGVFVRHVGGRSYGRSRQVLMRRNARVLNYRHPGYDELVAQFIAADPLLEARRCIDQRRLLECARRPVLLLSFDLAGGVERHVNQRQAALLAEHPTLVVLQGSDSPEERGRVRLRVVGAAAADPGHLVYDASRDLDELRALLSDLGLHHIELHHFLGIPDALLDVVVGLGVPYRVYIHDYAWICPRVSLLSGSGTYCGEPELAACEECVREHGAAFSEPITVSALRARSARILRGANRVIAPTHDVRRRLGRYFPTLEVEVIPWQPRGETQHPREPTAGARVRVALIGAIGTPKGYAVLLECARDAAARNLPVEFVVIGYTRDDSTVLETGRVSVTGPYEEDEAPALLERERCDVVLFPCQTPETWCYTLTYALAASLPIVALDLGAVAERLRAAGVGTLLPRSSAAPAINQALLQAAQNPTSLNPPARHPDSPMQSNNSSSSQVSQELNAAVQVIALPVGIYAFTVTGGGAPGRDGISLPSLLVAPAPVKSEGAIEFLEGPDTVGRWLTRTGDVVMVKISQQSATLLLTSLRGPDSSVLSIDIRKLDVQPAPEVVTRPPRARTLVHVRTLGDLEFNEGWAGGSADNLWIEAFAVVAQEPAAAELLEYSAVNVQGRRTEWLSGGAVCGSRGEETPLTAFAIRVKDRAGEDYSCVYTGKFLSGAVVGPCRDGMLCRSETQDDPLVAIEVQLDRQDA